MNDRKQGRRSAQDAEQTKCDILRVAAGLFCELGYERVSLRNISEKAGVSHSLIRHHFGSKDKIWYAISDGLHMYMERYMGEIVSNIPDNAKANEKLYFFVIRLLAHMLVSKQPIQLIADAVRQEDALFDYFIDRSGELQDIVFSIADAYNDENPKTPIKIWEIKWQMIMFAHGAASMAPFMKETWSEETNDYDECLLKHWNMFNQMMVSRFNIDPSLVSNPQTLSELVYDVPCEFHSE
ncbi:TetR/AcrR family transcriptional regulator [uncultured Vibrio sp.]|uniref:TetR/AcrR family transcriptional regulator n=1 Tax=uncultured Vibrio sp. TaxID=114054 RepID=UPI0025F12CBE|nr:TetR/AcrR family transcriptional regulator [uncultured Vibrio sp.]